LLLGLLEHVFPLPPERGGHPLAGARLLRWVYDPRPALGSQVSVAIPEAAVTLAVEFAGREPRLPLSPSDPLVFVDLGKGLVVVDFLVVVLVLQPGMVKVIA